MKRILTIAAVAAITIFPNSLAMAADTPPVTSTPTDSESAPPLFSDLPATNVNYAAIKYLKEQGILGGYSDGTFKPNQLVNRAEALKILLVGNKVQLPGTVDKSSFPDIKTTDWFVKYVEAGKTASIVKGNPDGTFAPSRNVSRAEFLKMLLTLNSFKTDNWTGKQMFTDIPKDAWFAAYLNYAGQAGLLVPDTKKMLYPAKQLSRGDVAEILYLMMVIRGEKDTQFLVDQSEVQMAQVEVYVGGNNPLAAKRASELATDLTQQALVNAPANNVVLGAAKLAKAYDFLMSAFIAAIQKDYVTSKNWADKAIVKAGEAEAVNKDLAEIVKHVKGRASEIVAQFPK